MQKKYKWLLLGIGLLIIVILGICFPKIDFYLNGEEKVTINYKQEYQEEGATLKIFGWNQDAKVKITSQVDSSKIGIYEVTYEMEWLHVKKTLTRMVEVADIEAPVLTPSFDAVIYILQEGKAIFPKFTAMDNYDGDVSASISIDSFDRNYIGVHFVKVSAVDQQGNEGIYLQPVAVYQDFEEVDESLLPLELEDGIYHMAVQEDQLVFEGYVQEKIENAELKLVGKKTVTSSIQPLATCGKTGYFQSVISVNELENDTYQIFYRDKALQQQAILSAQRLGRWHIGDKLVSFSYEGGIFMTVEDFAYQYDIAIDVGHGGDDVGAVGLGMYERDLNLMVSLYEKQRYEEHGLNVWLIRETKDYENLLGEEDWHILQQVSYTLGWYGAVSKYTYSNHHNSDTVGATSGPEIIVLPALNQEELAVEYRLYEEFQQVYQRINTDWPLFTRNYDNGKRFSKEKGEVYPMRVFYANMRYPWECFGVTVTTYEGAYINNRFDYDWYVKKENWKKVSEAKIKAYVEALGMEYQAPKM